MTEENTTEEPGTAGGEQGTEKVYSEKAFKAVTQQVGDLRSQLDAYRQKETETAAQQEEARKAKLIEQEKHTEVISGLESRLAEMQKSMDNQAKEIARGNLDRKLMDAGVSNPFTRKGLAAEYFDSNPESVEAFLESVKESAPDIFGAAQATGGKPSGAVGSVTNKTGTHGDLATRLKSDDPKIKRAAILERGRMKAEGKLPMDWTGD